MAQRTRNRLVETSTFLSYVLRHRPQTIGLALDPQGWAEVDELLAAARRHGRALDRELLAEVVATNDKQRFALSADGRRIRAQQGHSIAVDLELRPRVPPEILYHGTVGRNLGSIRAAGLLRGRRQHVHLSPDEPTAVRVGGRRGRPVVLAVRAGEMHASGHEFYLSGNGVWLTEAVPPEYIDFPED